MRKRQTLTESEWSKVFDLRCRSKRGERISEDEQALCSRAFNEDGKRYAAMNDRIFQATKPVGAQ